MAITDRALASRGLIRIRIKESGPTPRKYRKAYGQAAKASWRGAGKYHHTRHIPKRFTEAGARELGFRDRTVAYQTRKLRIMGHNNPNVWSGVSRRRAKRTNLTSTSKKVRMRYNVPALNFHSGARELRRASKKEAKRIADVYSAKNEEAIMKATQ